MAESHHSYQVPVQTNDATPLSPEEKQRQSEQFRQPGKVRFTPGVGVEYEQVESTTVTTPANILADPLNNAQDEQGRAVDLWDRGSLKDSEIRVPTPDGKGGVDFMTFDAAKRAGFYRRNAHGGFEATFVPGSTETTMQQPSEKKQDKQDPQQDQPQSADAADRVHPMPGDEALGTIALRIGDQTMYSLIADYAKGIELSDSRAESITQVLGGGSESTPAVTKQIWSALMTAYSTVGANALDEVGIAHVDTFLEWARANHQGKLTESFYDMVNQTKSTAKLKALGREYIAEKAGGWSDDQIAQMQLPEGASFLPRKSPNDPLIVRIPGYGDTPAKAAIRSGVLKV